jgi:hypothetical protein
MPHDEGVAESSDNHPTTDANRPTPEEARDRSVGTYAESPRNLSHDEDVRLVKPCDECGIPEATCASLGYCHRREAWRRIERLTDALMREHRLYAAFEVIEDEFQEACKGYDTKLLHRLEAQREQALADWQTAHDEVEGILNK